MAPKSSGASSDPAGGSSLRIRDIPTSSRQFWKPSFEEQRKQVVHDQTAEYNTRPLPNHELLVLSFQEIAAKRRRRGFSYYLPTRAGLTSNHGTDRLPPERHMPKNVSADYTDMLFVDFDWLDQDCDRFLERSHRERYLNSGFLTNAPPPATPITRIQYINRGNVAVNRMSTESLVLFDTASELYLIPSNALSNMFGYNKNTIKKPNYLWKTAELEKGEEEERQAKMRKLDELRNYSYQSLSDLYDAIVTYHQNGRHKISAEAFWQEIPHPQPDVQQLGPVGSALGEGASAEPPSRRGETRRRRGKAENKDGDMSDRGGEEESSAGLAVR